MWLMAALTAAIVTAAPVGGAGQAAGRLQGVVRDSTGTALPAVTVVIAGERDGATQSVMTGPDGAYAIASLAAGRYTVTATLRGFEQRSAAVDIGNSPITLNLVLSVALSESVTVTATKTGPADIGSTPGGITALTGETLSQLGARSLEDLAGIAPTLTVSQNAGVAVLALRGISSNATFPGSDPSVAVHLDGVYLSRPSSAFTDFLDVDRVEVLRGPQGTLYGRNSVGGTIHIITRVPTNDLEASARLTAGTYRTLRLEAALSGALVKNRVMGGVAILRSGRDGFVKDLGHPDGSLGSEDTWAGRGHVRFMLGRRGELSIAGDRSRRDGVPLTYAKPIVIKPGFTFEQFADPWTVRTNHAAFGYNTQQGGSARLSIGLTDTWQLSSLTAYRTTDFRFFIDADLTELPLMTVETPDRQHQASQEITVTAHHLKHSLVAGLFLFGEHDEGDLKITQYAQSIQIRPFPRSTAATWAIFGQHAYELTDRLSLTGGLRYTRERKDFHSTSGVYRLGTNVLAVPSSFFDFTDGLTHDVWTPKVAIQMRATADTFAYLSATRGFKGGGFNLTSPEPGRGYHPEFAWSYEGGIKTTLAGGRLRLNTALFYNDYEDLQVLSFIRLGVIDISNAASAVSKGVEVEASASGRGVTLSGNVSWLDARYQHYVAAGPAGSLNVSGNRLNFAPEWSGSAALTFEHPIANRGTGYVRADVAARDRVFFTAFNDPNESGGPYGVAHLRAGFRPANGRWDIAVYAKNITRQPYITGSANIGPAAIGGRPGEPRHWGTQLTIRR